MDSFSQDYKEYPRLKVLVSKHKIAKNIDKSFSVLKTRLQRLFQIEVSSFKTRLQKIY